MKTTFSTLACLLFTVFFSFGQPPHAPWKLSKQEIVDDLHYLDQFLQQYSSYQGLNGFSYQKAFDTYIAQLDSSVVDPVDFGIFLSEIIGQLGDRHSYVRGYDLPDNKFLPFVVAPYGKKVMALSENKATDTYELLLPDFPYLTAINDFPIDDFLWLIAPKAVTAPPAAFHTRAVKRLKYMEENYARMQLPLPELFAFEFSTKDGSRDTLLQLPLVGTDGKFNTWDEKFYWQHSSLDDEDYNKVEIAEELFLTDKNNIGYLRLPSMLKQKDAPIIFDALHLYMQEAANTKALIVDVRSNSGGVRELIWELAGYFVHPDSIYVVNVAQQRGDRPLSAEWKEDLNNRYLYSLDQLDEQEQASVARFMPHFQPRYSLPEDKFSVFHYALFNGSKLSAGKYHYNKPIYVLANERSFSAASVLAAAFKGLPNIILAGAPTDGSSGNSERFKLPNSELRCKISTMVSFQKDGQLLDGTGTQPDLLLPRTHKHIFWQEDAQLKQLKVIINQE